MKTSEPDFRKWFVESLEPLRTNGHAAFIFVLTAFPLLERYLRRKSGCPDGQNLTPRFFTQVGVLFPQIAGHENQFWDCYRNGLLHHGTFPTAKFNRGTGIWVPLPESGLSGYDSRPVYFLPETNQFFLNPMSFFDTVVTAILSDFVTYEGSATPHYGLPTVLSPETAVPHTAATIGWVRTGSYTP